jgi:hypothetical protein
MASGSTGKHGSIQMSHYCGQKEEDRIQILNMQTTVCIHTVYCAKGEFVLWISNEGA